MRQTITYLTLLFSAIVICFIFANKAFSQEYTREGNNFTKVQTIQQSTDTITSYTYTIKNEVYPIWITKNGRCYIIRTSKRGNEYKQYLEESISRQICAELGIEYKETTK